MPKRSTKPPDLSPLVKAIQLAIETLRERMVEEGVSVEDAYELEKADHPQLGEIVYEMAVDAIKAELSI